MNNDRRKAIRALIDRLGPAATIIDEVREELESIKDDEQEYFDNMPESLQSGERGQLAEGAICALEEALETLGDLSFDDLTGHMETACE